MTIVAPQSSSDTDEEEAVPTVPTLTAGLLGVRRPAGPVNDLLWLNLVIGEEKVLSSPTAEGAMEAAYRVHGNSAWCLGASLRDSNGLDALVRARQLTPLWAGAAQNPYLLRSTMEFMQENATLAGDAANTVAQRLAVHTLLDRMEEKGTWSDITATLIASRDADALVRAYTAFGAATGISDALAAFEVTPVNGGEEGDAHKSAMQVLDAQLRLREAFLVKLAELDQAAADSIHEHLLMEAKSVDASLLEWLKGSESFEAEMLRALVFPEGGVKDSSIGKALARRLHGDAAWWALESGDLADLARFSPTRAGYTADWRNAEPPALKPSQAVLRAERAAQQRSLLMTLKVTGVDDTEIAPMILNGAIGLEDDEVLDIIAAAGTTYIAEFLSGAKPVTPSDGDVDRVWSRITPDQREAVFTVLKDHTHLGDLPWSAELTLAVPGLLAKGLSGPVLWSANRILTERFEDNVPAWETALALVTDWSSSIDELTQAVQAIVPDEGRSRVKGMRIEEVSKMLYGPDAEKDLQTGEDH